MQRTAAWGRGFIAAIVGARRLQSALAHGRSTSDESGTGRGLRGNAVESAHRGALAVVDADGGMRAGAGRHRSGRSFRARPSRCCRRCRWWPAARPTRLQLTDEELALACASHNGEPAHVATAAGMLAKAGRGRRARWNAARTGPTARPSSARWPRAARQPSALHNNCSGKHAGFVCLACLLAGGRDRCATTPRGYVQRRAPGDARGDAGAAGRHRLRPVARAAAASTAARSRPSRIPLRHLALAFARVGTGIGLRAGHARGRAAAAPGGGEGAVHGRRHRPLRHAGDAAPGRARVLQGRRRGRVLRRAARAAAWAWR